jgi:hypothetical protein
LAASCIAANQLGDRNGSAPYSDWTGYAPVNTPDELRAPFRWQPLRVNGQVQAFTTPHWREVAPFALTESSARPFLPARRRRAAAPERRARSAPHGRPAG